MRTREVPSWWTELPETEKRVIRTVLGAARNERRSADGKVAAAARKWDRALTCFIRSRLVVESRAQELTACRARCQACKEEGGRQR